MGRIPGGPYAQFRVQPCRTRQARPMATWVESARLGGLATPLRPVCARPCSNGNGRALATLARPVAHIGAGRRGSASCGVLRAGDNNAGEGRYGGGEARSE
jgi:hypothetical protein